jgi:hypothetical protein
MASAFLGQWPSGSGLQLALNVGRCALMWSGKVASAVPVHSYGGQCGETNAHCNHWGPGWLVGQDLCSLVTCFVPRTDMRGPIASIATLRIGPACGDCSTHEGSVMPLPQLVWSACS